MNLSYRWLQQFVTTSLDPQQLAERLRLTSAEVEGVTDYTALLEGLVVGHILAIESHPNADRLHVTTVDVGEASPRQIVCGAPNVASDQFVIVALPGVRLQAREMTIERTVIRGVESNGMLCAWDEIGLPLSSEGIIVLDHSVQPGSSAAVALGFDDSIIDLEITPNRPDLLGVYGLAREVSSFEHRALRPPSLAVLPPASIVDMASRSLCQRYTSICLEHCTVTDSPEWLQRSLLLAGIKPINTVVDCTNYVMQELGLPLHAFDGEKVGRTRVRLAKTGESLLGLNGEQYQLTHSDTIVVDANNQPIALAGIIGGATSGITASTTKILIEAAVFIGAKVRQTSRRLQIRTEASNRMEKGLDAASLDQAIARVVWLLQEVAGASVVANSYLDSGLLNPVLPVKINVGYEQIQSILGIHINLPQAKQILTSLGFTITRVTKSALTVTPPTWRQDVRLPEDVIEELIRIWGYHRVPKTLPSGILPAPQPNLGFVRKRLIRHALAAYGLSETISLSLTSATALTRTSLDVQQAVPVLLPLSREGEYLIPEHLVPFLQNLSGPNRLVEQLGLFEIGAVFRLGPSEQTRLSLLLRSNRSPEPLYRQAKGFLTQLAALLNLPEVKYDLQDPAPSYALAETALQITIDGRVVGTLSQISSEVVANWKIRTGRTLIYLTLELGPWLTSTLPTRRVQAAPSFPVTTRDLSVIVPEEIGTGDVLTSVQTQQNSSTVFQPAALTSIYRANPGEKSITIHLQYSANDHTLTDQEVEKDYQLIITQLQQQFSARLT